MDAMPKPIRKVGHVVLKMRDLEKAKAFYCGVLGMTLANFDPDRGMFLRFDDYHHDIAIFKTPIPPRRTRSASSTWPWSSTASTRSRRGTGASRRWASPSWARPITR
jgi:catechol 2,3-dioxygenase-like lactoylglutathione lyase family enzyme